MKIFLGFLAAALVLALAAVHFYNDHQSALIELVDAERATQHMRNSLAERKALQETLKRHYDLQRQVFDTNQALSEARSVMNELKSEIETQKSTFQGMLNTRRAAAQGKVLGTVELADGRSLRDMKILSFDDSTLTVQTDSGIVKVRAQDLPARLQDYFRFDLIEPELGPALTATNPFENNPDMEIGAFKYSTNAMVPASNGEPDKQKTLSMELTQINRQIIELERAKHAPLAGLDARLRAGSAIHRYRKKFRDDKLNQEIARLQARQRSIRSEQKEIQKVSTR